MENQRGVVTLDKKLFKRLVESMGQMDEIVRGARAPSREFYVDVAKVKEIRAIAGLSQPKFAKLLHFDVGTLRNWEQGRREPTGPAQALLRAIRDARYSEGASAGQPQAGGVERCRCVDSESEHPHQATSNSAILRSSFDIAGDSRELNVTD